MIRKGLVEHSRLQAWRETNLEITKDHNQLEAFLSLISENVPKMNNTYILNSTS